MKNDICSVCSFEFEESSVQYYRRIKISFNAPKICRDCHRIKNADKNAEKRKKSNKVKTTHEKLVEIKKQFGYLCTTIVRRRLQISYENAIEIINNFNNETNNLS